MAQDPSSTRHTVIITGLKDKSTKANVARTIARITKNVPIERILEKLDSLPWTLTRNAPEEMASRLVLLLDKRGAITNVIPPLPDTSGFDLSQTMVSDGPIRPARTDTQLLVPPGRPDTPRRAQPDSRPRPAPPRPPSRPRPSPGPLEIEPLTLGGILDRTFQICRRHFWKLLGILVIPWLATVGLVAIVTAAVGVFVLTEQTLGQTPVWLLLVVVTAGAALLIVLVALFYLAQGALIYAVSCVYSGLDVLVGKAYGFVFKRLGRYVLTSLLFLTAIVFVMIVTTIAGLVLYFMAELLTPSGWWSAVTWPLLLFVPAYAIPKMLLFDKVVIIEDTAYTAALSRSWNLLSGKAEGPRPRGYFVRLIILFHVFILINIAISLLFEAPAALLTLVFPDSLKVAGQIIGQFMSSAGNLVAGIFAAVCLVVFYYDIRNRKEGFDLKMLAKMHEER